MIAFVKGILEEIRPGKVVIEVNGIGLNVLVPEALTEELPSIGNEVKLYTYMSVREDGMSLYGFLTRDSLDLFNELIGVSNVGPKAAQSILSTYSVPMIKFYIVSEDVSNLSKASGIGRKTAERIIVDLKDKLSKEDLLLESYKDNFKENELSNSCMDAIEALVTLGYDKKAAKEAVMKIDHSEELDTNQILKLSLQYMFN